MFKIKFFLKLQTKFRNEKDDKFIEEMNKIELGANNRKPIQWIDSKKTKYVKKKKINVKIQKNNTKVINFDDITREKIGEHNKKWPQIPYPPYRI